MELTEIESNFNWVILVYCDTVLGSTTNKDVSGTAKPFAMNVPNIIVKVCEW